MPMSLFLFAVFCLLPMISIAQTQNGIEVWRDQRGVLNISNIHNAHHAHRTHSTLVYDPGTFTPPAVLPKHLPPPPPIAIAHTKIYAYTDEHGIKCFTNIPTGSQRYALVLQSDFGQISPYSGFLAERRSTYDAIVTEASRTYQVDQALVRAVIHTESAFNPMAVSPKGASGLMQLMPGTAQRYGVRDVFNPTENVYGGVHYLRDLLDTFNNNLSLAVAAYNAGENAVSRYGDIPPYAETNNYVRRVLALQANYQSIREQRRE